MATKTNLSALGPVVEAQVKAAVEATKKNQPVPPGTYLYRTLNFVTKDSPWKADDKGVVTSTLEGADPSFVLCGDGTLVQRQDFKAASTLVGPFRFSAHVRLADSGKASPLLEADMAAPPTVLDISLAPTVSPDLGFTVAEVQATPNQLAPSTVTGKDVIVGIVDYGFDFAHPNFLHPIDPANPVPKTRLLALWDQNDLGTNTTVSTLLTAMGISAAGYENSYVYGPDGQVPYKDAGTPKMWPAAAARDINKQLEEERPYASYYDPHQRYFTWPDGANPTTNTDIADQFGAHGTHVADIAAGNGQGTGRPGVAPQADIVFVQLPSPANPGGPPTAKNVLDAVQFIARFAKDMGKRCVINVSANFNAGPHTALVDQDLAKLDTYPEGTWDAATTDYQPIVVSAGNQFVLGREPVRLPTEPLDPYPKLRKAYRESLQRRIGIEAGGDGLLLWVCRNGDTTSNTLEVWYRAGAAEDVAIKVESSITTAATQTVANANSDANINLTNGTLLGKIAARGTFAANKPRRVQIELNFSATAPCPQDVVFVVTITSGAKRSAQAFVQRDNMDVLLQSALAVRNAKGEPNMKALLDGCSLGALACGGKTISVSAYFAPDRTGRGAAIAEFSSGGPAIDFSSRDLPTTGVGQPWISAPGMIVLGAKSKGGRSYRSGSNVQVPRQPYAAVMSGTSMAAPHVTGAIALVLDKKGARIPNDVLRTALAKAARREAPWFDPAEIWHPRMGYGRLDIKATLAIA